jgi:hypothetical protein
VSIAGGIENAGTLTVTDSTLSGNSAGVGGSGIYNGGTLAVRGLVTIDGDYAQTGDGTLDVRIGGLMAGTDYSQLIVNGFAALSGTLAVTLTNGYQPQPGDRFQVLPLVGLPLVGAAAGYRRWQGRRARA